MHGFVVDRKMFGQTEPHRRDPTVTDRSIIVFGVFGTDVKAYKAALAKTGRILSYELSQLPGDSFFIVVGERLDVAGMR